MSIRIKITLQFVIIVTVIFILASVAIYYFSAQHRKEDFYKRLHNKSLITAKMLIEVEEVTADVLTRIELNNPTNLPHERVRIYNYKNEMIYSSDQDEKLSVDSTVLDEIRLNGEIRYKNENAEILGYHYQDKFDRFVVIISAVDIYGLKKLNNLKLVLIVVFSLSIIVIFISGYVFAGRALHPINKLIGQLDDISIKSLDLRLSEGNGKDELARLAKKFNEMLIRLEKSFKLQENFIANASHELRTPLTAILGQLEVVLFKDRDIENYKSTISSVQDEINNLIQIANKLLLLAQATSEKTIRDFKSLRIDEVIGVSIADVRKRMPEYHVDFKILRETMDESCLTVGGNESLLKIAIVNLIDNGCKFSEDKRVLIVLDNSDHFIRIDFKDHGFGIPEDDLPFIFEPFHRGRNILKIKGHGIGLSIVDMIVKLHNGRLSFNSVLNKGSIFTLILPQQKI